MTKRVLQFILNREWAMAIAFLGGCVLAIQEQAEILPDDVEGYVLGGLAIVGGWVTRLRVWSGASVIGEAAPESPA